MDEEGSHTNPLVSQPLANAGTVVPIVPIVPVVPVVPIVPNHRAHCAHCAHCAQVELAKRSGYVVVSGDGAGKLYYVKNIAKADGKQYEVDMRRGMDTVDCCEHVCEHKQPCRHMVCVFWQQKMLSNQRKMKQVVHDF